MCRDVKYFFGDQTCIYLYQYKRSGKYLLVRSKTLEDSDIRYASLSPDRQFMAISTTTQTFIDVTPFKEGFSKENKAGKSIFNKFSKNMKYLITTEYMKTSVYMINCNWNVTGSLFNESAGLCQMCDYGCALCENLTYCAVCDEERFYARSNNSYNCVPCSDGYFILNNTCYACIENCKTCSNDEECEVCIGGYFSNPDDNMTCWECQEHCYSCENEFTCVQCFEREDYGLNASSGECIKCL